MRLAVLLAACLLFPGCVSSFTPPIRTMPIETPAAPSAGDTDVGLDSAASALVYDDTAVTTNTLRVRHGVNATTAIEAEGGLLHVEDAAYDDVEHLSYLGRVGVNLHTADAGRDGQKASTAMVAGIGAGVSPTTGRWVSGDVGFVGETSGDRGAVFAGLDTFYSHPVETPPITTDDQDRLRDTGGMRSTLGIEIFPQGRTGRVSLTGGVSLGLIGTADDMDWVAQVAGGVRIRL
jgi:hypothetical protein